MTTSEEKCRHEFDEWYSKFGNDAFNVKDSFHKVGARTAWQYQQSIIDAKDAEIERLSKLQFTMLPDCSFQYPEDN